MKIINLKPPLWCLILLGASWMAQLLFHPTRIVQESKGTVLGIILLSFGVVLLIWAVGYFKRYNTAIKPTDEPSTLIQKGPYRFSRNPIYIAAILGLLGIAFWIGTLPFFFTPIVFFCLVQLFFIPFEEGNLKKVFKDRYLSYEKRVRRWL